MNQQTSISEIKHQIWLRCMQMSNCTPQDAVDYINQVSNYLSHALTPQNQNILMIASSIGAYYIVQQCIIRGVNVDLVDSAGRTALHYAAAIGDIRIFQQIVHNGGNVYAKTIGGQTPLMKACIFCQGQIIQWYLNNGLQAFKMNDFYGKTPLQMLKLSGEGLYQQVSEVYKDLAQQTTETEMKD